MSENNLCDRHVCLRSVLQSRIAELEAENVKLNRAVQNWYEAGYADECRIREKNKKIHELEQQNAKLVDALKFYSDLNSYYVNGRIDMRNHITDSDLELVYKNEWIGGKLARTVLSELGIK